MHTSKDKIPQMNTSVGKGKSSINETQSNQDNPNTLIMKEIKSISVVR